MLTRLIVDGFKNLEHVDVRFGPFTCVAGANGVGKSNLFDAIAFLSALADHTLVEAASMVRGTEGRVGDVRSLFRQDGDARAQQMSFKAEMIVPSTGVDDLGSEAQASLTFLRYKLTLRLRETQSTLGPIEVVREELEHINQTGAGRVLGFPHAKAWRESVILGKRNVPYIETEDREKGPVVVTRADSVGGKGGGRPRTVLATTMPKTLLATANNAGEHRTLVLARKEMIGWTQFQLEPTALRAPAPFTAVQAIAPNGGHLPAALFGLARDAERTNTASATDVYQGVANRLAELFENVSTLRVDVDEKRELYSIILTDLQHTDHHASSLSDGTLRFLALAILEASAHGPSVLCLEEPENGIHPDRIPAMIELLRDVAVDVTLPVDASNPMRQVIINTHSPGVVQAVPEDSLVLAESQEVSVNGRRSRRLRLRGMAGTWRGEQDPASLSLLLGYLSATSRPASTRNPKEKRVMDREDVRQVRLFGDAS